MQQRNFISFGERPASPVDLPSSSAATPSSPAASTQQTQFRSVNCEVLSTESSTAAILTLSQPVTVRAPCAIVGLVGHCLVQGFHLRQRALLLDQPGAHVAVQPLPKDKQQQQSRSAGSATAAGGGGSNNKALEAAISSWGASCSGAAATLNHIVTGAPLLPPAAAAATAAEKNVGGETGGGVLFSTTTSADLAMLRNVEERFGKMNWSWIRQTMSDISQRAGSATGHNAHHTLNEHVLLLVMTDNTTTAAAAAAGSSSAVGGDDEQQQQQQQSLPFFAPRMAPAPHYALQDTLLPGLLGGSSSSATPPRVLVAGAVNTGKSTTARFICNNLLSLHGECLWVDLDLGQSEFSVPGGIGVFRVRRPLFVANQALGVERIAFHFLGAPTMRDPVAMSLVLESICESALSACASGVRAPAVRRQRQATSAAVSDNNDSTVAAAAAAAGQQQNSNRIVAPPMVINTHGWVLSTGRRATLEALQRLRPNQVVHLVAPNGADDSRWLLPAGEAASGESGGSNNHRRRLSGDVVGTRFQSPSLGAMPSPAAASASGRSAAPFQYTLHRFSLDRLFEKDAGENRQRQWCRYFRDSPFADVLLGSKSSNNSKIAASAAVATGVSGISEVSVSLNALRLVYCEEDAMPWVLRGRRSCISLLEGSSSKAEDRSIMNEIRETLHCALVAVSLDSPPYQPQNSKLSFVVVESLAALPSGRSIPNVCGMCLALLPERAWNKGAAATVTLVGPVALVNAIENQQSRQQVSLVVGWQQFDPAWSAEIATRTSDRV